MSRTHHADASDLSGGLVCLRGAETVGEEPDPGQLRTAFKITSEAPCLQRAVDEAMKLDSQGTV